MIFFPVLQRKKRLRNVPLSCFLRLVTLLQFLTAPEKLQMDICGRKKQTVSVRQRHSQTHTYLLVQQCSEQQYKETL